MSNQRLAPSESSFQLPADPVAADAIGTMVSGTLDAPSEPVSPAEGQRFGQYELIRELGRGGMGTVFLARDTKLGRRVAIKFLQVGNNPELAERFVLEARATALCSHENIVVIHEVGEHTGMPFMVLEYLHGAALSQHMAGGQRVSPGRAIELMVPVVRALVCAHEHDIVHRDLKPDNIFVTASGTVKVLDFGIAKLVQGQRRGGLVPGSAPGPAARLATGSAPAVTAGPWPDAGRMPDADLSFSNGSLSNGELTRYGALVGTMPFMSPEQWMGVGVDHRTDVWATGIILFMLIAGHHPLAPLRGQQLMVTAALDEPMPPAAGLCPDIPEGLADVIDRCLIKPKEQRIGSARELLDVLEPLLPGRGSRRMVAADRSPYAGLSAFQETDADRFFGRGPEIAAMVARLRDRPLIGVVGPSGVGKSSFVRAGVVPALKRSGEPWETLVIRPGRNPLAAVANLISSMVRVSAAGTVSASGVTGDSPQTTLAAEISGQQVVQQRLRDEPGFLGTVLRSRARRHDRRILLFVDQFEELYTLIPDLDERLAFTACLAGVADDVTAPLRVVLSIRSDFLDRAAEDAHFMSELTQGLFFLLPPSRDGLRESLIQPAEMAGYRFESESMVEHMLDTLASTSGALPLLQFTAAKLWEARNTQYRLLTEHSYMQMGGMVGALASHADAVLAEQTPQARALVRAIFLRLVTPERTRAIVSVAELRELAADADELQRLVDHLVHARLLVVQTGGAEGASVEIVHESLIHTWPMLRRWLDENQDDAAYLEQLRTAARQWDTRGRPVGLLWRGEAADEARRWRRRYRGELPALQVAYLDAVLALGTRAARVRRALMLGATTLSILVAAGAIVALVLIRDAERAATAQAAAAQSAEQRMRSQYHALQSALERQQKAEQEAREALIQAEAANREVAEREGQLADTNEELLETVDRAEQARRRARRASRRARRDEEKALHAEAEARSANQRLADMLAREQERVKRLTRQLGSTIFEDLN